MPYPFWTLELQRPCGLHPVVAGQAAVQSTRFFKSIEVTGLRIAFSFLGCFANGGEGGTDDANGVHAIV